MPEADSFLRAGKFQGWLPDLFLGKRLHGGTLGLIGALVGWSIGLSVGGTTLLAVLAGSASYIAAPAAMRIAVPEANPSLSLTASLGITFPFNIFAGIPLYFAIAKYLHGTGA